MLRVASEDDHQKYRSILSRALATDNGSDQLSIDNDLPMPNRSTAIYDQFAEYMRQQLQRNNCSPTRWTLVLSRRGTRCYSTRNGGKRGIRSSGRSIRRSCRRLQHRYSYGYRGSGPDDI
jgi:hypothetical protein